MQNPRLRRDQVAQRVTGRLLRMDTLESPRNRLSEERGSSARRLPQLHHFNTTRGKRRWNRCGHRAQGGS